VKRTLDALLRSQKTSRLPFRIALHYGDVLLGGARSFGEDSVSGLELVLLFRMEKLAGNLNRTFLCSEAAADKLQPMAELEYAGEHLVSGFVDNRPRRFFGLRAR
jgi:class 3 adenylate cyclase